MTRVKAKRLAEANGHLLGNFKARLFSKGHYLQGKVMYYVAWCERCGDVCFTEDKTTGMGNPAVEYKCSGRKML
jgi:hypothetical protein